MLTVDEIAKRLDVPPTTVKTWRRAGLLVAHLYDDKGGYLFEPPGTAHR
jgi:DNA-binding transcriptional MerR regulator